MRKYVRDLQKIRLPRELSQCLQAKQKEKEEQGQGKRDCFSAYRRI